MSLGRVPRAYIEGAHALGLSRWGVVQSVAIIVQTENRCRAGLNATQTTDAHRGDNDVIGVDIDRVTGGCRCTVNYHPGRIIRQAAQCQHLPVVMRVHRALVLDFCGQHRRAQYFDIINVERHAGFCVGRIVRVDKVSGLQPAHVAEHLHGIGHQRAPVLVPFG